MSVSIGSQNQNDASYRYKMPKLVAKVEGRGNGIKTVIVNMTDIAKALHCEPSYPTKFFGIELGAQSKYVPSTERAIVNGRHDQPDLANLLDKFIQMFILCPNCHLPELSMHVSKTIKIDCAACGHNGVIGTNHKLTTYILKNPPSGGKAKATVATAKDKDKPTKKKRESKDDDSEEDADDAEPAAAAEVKKPEPPVSTEVEWFTDTSEEATQQRKQAEFDEMVKATQAMDLTKDLTKEPPEIVLRMFMEQKSRDVAEILSELRRLQLSRGLDDTQKLQVLLRAIIKPDEAKKVPSVLAKHAELLSKFTKNQLIGCLEEYVGVQEKGLLKFIPHIFKALYEADVLDEETIVNWYEAPPESSWLVQRDVAVSLRKKVKPIIDWLKNAEEESDGDAADS